MFIKNLFIIFLGFMSWAIFSKIGLWITLFIMFYLLPPMLSKKTISYVKSKTGSFLSKLMNMNISPFFFFENLNILFTMVFFINLSGLLVLEKQMFLNKLSLSLIMMSLFMWSFSYLPFLFSKKEKFTLFVIGEMKFPILSYLLSNIEILTHVFRPITLSARLWVNIWVGHLIMSSISFIFLLNLGSIPPIKSETFQFLFFFFESGIMFLQTYVFSYLVKVYFEENFAHSI